MLIRVWNRIVRVMKDNRGFVVSGPVAAMIGSAAIGGLSGFFGNKKKKDKTQTTTAAAPVQLPDYAESEGARKTWWEKLQGFGGQPGYGAIAPNWQDIWSSARGKVQRYFRGGPEGPGLIGQVRANLARRNVSESPAAETMIGRLGMKEGDMLSDMAVKQAVQEAQFGESGRQNWLSSITQLAGLKPSFMGGGSTTTVSGGGPSYGAGNAMSDIAGALGGYFQQQEGRNWYEKMLEKTLSGGLGSAVPATD